MHKHIPRFELLEKSRKRPEPGDWFAMLRDDGRYYFGRVIRTDASVASGGLAKEVLVYVFRESSKSPVLPRRLSPDDLALPPQIINRRGWLAGYFRTIQSDAIQPGEALERHCFSRSNGTFSDEYGVALDGPSEPVGFAGLGNWATIDLDLCKLEGRAPRS